MNAVDVFNMQVKTS